MMKIRGYDQKIYGTIEECLEAQIREKKFFVPKEMNEILCFYEFDENGCWEDISENSSSNRTTADKMIGIAAEYFKEHGRVYFEVACISEDGIGLGVGAVLVD